MAKLSTYKQKRDFNKTSEPVGGDPEGDKLIFVVQKHDASHLHYDFRLELRGVLKSWAVPKGPSLNPDDRRLCIEVEDHPFSYKDFEGTIPAGEYGGGTVMVWDTGWYEPVGEFESKVARERRLTSDYHKGSMEFILHGEKLKGKFILVKSKGDKYKNGWLLIKVTDRHVSKKDVLARDKSAISGRSLEKISLDTQGASETKESDSGGIPLKGKEASQAGTEKKIRKSIADKGTGSEKDQVISLDRLLKGAPKTKMPLHPVPMKATLIDEPFDEDGWIYEIKWDGYRALAQLDGQDVKLISRNNIPFEHFSTVIDELRNLNIKTVLDGEIVVLNDNDMPDFGALQNWRNNSDGTLVYYVFDVLWFDGHSLIDKTLLERKMILQHIFTANPVIRRGEYFDADGVSFFQAAARAKLEGIIAKRTDSTYREGSRTRDWLKVKVQRRQEVVIGGFTRNEDTVKPFSALTIGVYEGKKLRYIGKVGTGWTEARQKEMMKLFKPLISTKCPFETEPDVNKPTRYTRKDLNAAVTWLKPRLVCEVNIAEFTKEGIVRQASFKGMREDKNPEDIMLEIPAEPVTKPAEGDERIKPPVASASEQGFLNASDTEQHVTINRCSLKFTNLNKIYWPGEGITKRDMFNYYDSVSDLILPYIKNRAMSLHRFPNGIKGKSFYQKDVSDTVPDCMQTLPHTTSDGKEKEYLVARNKASLLWMASLGCIEMNPWFSRISKSDYPDFCVLDLDPDKNTFDQVVEAARLIHDILDDIGVPSFAKTSGSTGMHIYIPLGAKYTYDQSQMFAKLIAGMLHKQIPEYTSLERMVKNRGGKMYIDYLQNRPEATIACAYSLRPKPGATVSMPLNWDDVRPGIKVSDYTIFNVTKIVSPNSDPFKGVLGRGIDLEKVLKKLNAGA